MKRLGCIAFLTIFILSGCVMTKAPIQGTIFTDVKHNSEINLPKVQGKMVEGRAMATGILGFVTGDCSYEAALKDALSRSGARALSNIIVDHHVKNVLFIYAEYTTIVKGFPVRK